MKNTFILLIILFAFQVNAQIVYTNLNKLTASATYQTYVSIDISGFNNKSVSFANTTIDNTPQTEVNYSVKAYQDGLFCVENEAGGFVGTLNYGDVIDGSLQWQYVSEWNSSNKTLTIGQSEYPSGPWANSTKKYYAFKTYEEDNIYYGWIRLSITNNEKMIEVLDYAYNSTPNQEITAGEGIDFSVFNIQISCESEFINEEDLYLSFDLPADNDSISLYKIFVVPSTMIETFDLTYAESVEPGNYMELSDLSDSYNGHIQSGTKDVEGNSIVEDATYKVYIMCSYQFGSDFGNELSQPSNELITGKNITYTNPEPDDILQGVHNLSSYSVDFNNDGIGDLDFNYLAEEYFDGEYTQKIELCSSSESNSGWIYNVNFGSNYNINSDYYYGYMDISYFNREWVYDEENDSLYMEWDCNIQLENKIIACKFEIGTESYLGWVRISSNCNKRQLIIKDYAYTSSNSIIIGDGIRLLPEDINIMDISDNHNASDIHLSFSKAFLKQYIEEYRVIIVPSESVGNFNVESAELLSSDRYFTISEDDYSDTLPQDLLDYSGNTIIENVAYKAFILCVSSNSFAHDNNLVECPDEIILQTYTPPVTNLQINSEYLGGTDYSINLSFDTPEDESGINEYRAFLVPDTEFESFDTTIANSILDDYLYYETNSQSGNILAIINSSEITDINGNSVNRENEYKIAIMSVTNWNITNQNSIVISDSTISFSNPCLAVGSVYLQDIGSLNSSSDIEINFTIPKNTTQISEFRIYFVKENNTDDFNLEIADELPEQNFISVDISEVTEEEYSFAIAEGVLDVNEEPVVKDQEYIVFVVSVANGITANYNAISDPSPRFIFGEPFYFQTGMKYGDNINYFDIDGEFIVYSSGWPEEVTKELDINSDGINDISFIAYSGSSPSYSATGASIQTSDYTSVCIIESDYLNYLPEHLSINDNMIWNTGHLTFRNQGFSPNSPNYTNGVWQNDIPAYMISRTVTDNDTIFAWFKVSIYTKYNAKINIHDYAVYGESINSEEIFPINFTICPNPSTGIVNITFENYTNPIEFEIYDISGRVILHDVAKLKYHSLDLSYLSKGMYFIKTNSIKQSAVKFILN